MASAGGRARGFTLIELLVVMGIIALLLAIILPALGGAKEAALEAKCLSNLHQLSVASIGYVEDNDGYFWEYNHTQGPDTGVYWWFGFEKNGPGGGTNRPIDLSQSALADYLTHQGAEFQCPSFPYDHPDYYSKFEREVASYGYNWRFSGLKTFGGGFGFPTEAVPPHKFERYASRTSKVFVFADSIFFEPGNAFNEGFYIDWQANVADYSGYAHYRHRGRAQVGFLDGHAAAQQLQGGHHAVVDGGKAGNLSDEAGGNSIYGF